ncbi:MAG TPA: AprI/Inh family metalloprotease inhibitor [Roseiarcus sp.]|nr:AprI/Inh family metalloprotease inhibitor [Roseiarcus sp.]
MAFENSSARRGWSFLWAAGAIGLSAMGAQAQSRVEAAGRYALLRAEDKDTGCMLTLEPRPVAGGFKAQLAPACRDNGLVVFDPVAWNVERGRLSLTARKGHKTHFDRQSNGVWLRDVKEGKALSLRPL